MLANMYVLFEVETLLRSMLDHLQKAETWTSMLVKKRRKRNACEQYQSGNKLLTMTECRDMGKKQKCP